jgi:hypothetical protein
MFHLGVLVVCSSPTGVFLRGSSLPCIDVDCVCWGGRHLLSWAP